MADTITTWTPISAPTDFQDDAVFNIDFKTKTVQVLVEQPIVAGENKSQFIKFQIGRYYDAIDLTAMQVNIVFLSPAGNRGISAAVNTEYSDDAIRFGWLVPYEACHVKGKLYFAVEFVGADYTLKTTAGCTDVLDSISDRDIVPEPVEQEWYIVLQANVATLMQEAQSALGRVEGIFNALGTPLSAGTAAEMTEESAIYVYTGSEPNYEYGYWYYHDGTAWHPGGEYASTDYLIDKTLSKEGQAADAKAVGDALDAVRSSIGELDAQINGGSVLGPTVITPTSENEISVYISPSAGTWQTGNRRGYIIALGDSVKVSITASDSYTAEYAFLANNSAVAGESASIVGDTVPSTLASGESVSLDVPEGAVYIYIRRMNNNGYIVTPTEIVFYRSVPVGNSVIARIASLEASQSAIDTATETDEGKYLKAKTVENGKVIEWEFAEGGEGTEEEITQLRSNVDELDAQINGGSILSPVVIDLATSATEIGYYISANATWVSGKRRGYIASIGTAEKVAITADATYNCEYAFLDSDEITDGGTASIVGDTSPTTLTAGTSTEVNVPTGATTLYCRRINASGYVCTPAEVVFYIRSQGGDSIVSKVAKIDGLETAVATIADDYDGITANLPFVYALENKTINTSGVITDSTKFLLSDVIQVKTGQTFAVNLPYAVRIVYYSDEGETVQSVTNWGNSYTFSQDKYIRLHFRNHLHQNDDLTAEEVTGEITTDTALGKNFIPIASKADISNFDRYNLNQPFVGKEDMMWNWWSYPQIISFKRVRNKLYWTYTTHEGYSGIASYDFDSHEIVKNHLKKGVSPDDHDNATVFILSDGTVLVAYTEGHYANHKIYIRRSLIPESVEAFGEAIEIDTADYVSYARILEYNGTLYMWYRSYLRRWNYMTSTDGGQTWSAETIAISATMQYYCLVMPTTTDGIFRIVMYSNPNEADPNIRLGFFHCADGGLYDADNSTLLGTSSVSATDFDIIIATETGKTQRLLDCAVTAPNVTKVLYCPFTEQADTTPEEDLVFDAVYKIYDSGNTITVCDAGYTIWKQRYQGGASWIDDNSLILSRCDDTYDYIETYSLSGSTVTKDEELHKEAIGTIPIRNARPIADVNGKAVMWWRGYYNRNDYRDFNTDAEMHIIT